MKKYLILTAGYGEGHNSAAKAVGEVLAQGNDVRVCDLCADALPVTFALSKRWYLWMTSHVSWLWRCLYDLSDTSNWSEGVPPGLGAVAKRLEGVMREWCPDAVVCTFPLYPYLLDAYFRVGGRRVPYVTVVTDSLSISRTWFASESRLIAVTDRWTRDLLVEEKGLAAERVIETGFPVSLRFAPGASAASWRPGAPFRVLYVPQGTPAFVASELKALLSASPDVHVTVVLGRKVRRFYRVVSKVSKCFDGRVLVKGWTGRMPELLASHHLLLSKAGGASVHEALAAEVPVLVNHFVPGQEEGNTELLHRLGGGRFVETPKDLQTVVARLMADEGLMWSTMKSNLQLACMRGGAERLAKVVQRMVEYGYDVPADR